VEGHGCEKEKAGAFLQKLQGQPAEGLMERHVVDYGWLALTRA
jgi:hypothetical protein